MKAVDLIHNDVPPILPEESMEKALSWMDEFKVKHLPVVKDGKYLGLISDEMILDHNTLSDDISQLSLMGRQYAVKRTAHMYKVIHLMSSHLLTLVPVVDDQYDFFGSISSNHLMKMIALHTGFNQSGAVIVLQINDFDYQMSQIAQIVESNNAKILGFYTESLLDSNQLRVTIKLNQSKLGPVLQTFSRYDYQIYEIFTDDETTNEYQDRYDHLMNYLNIDI
tara:strand:- start:356 stop:1024 length:669 start_codon:yes stop_codon:yes gene_type:complete